MILYCKIHMPENHAISFIKELREFMVGFEHRAGIVAQGVVGNPDEFHVEMVTDMRSRTTTEVEAQLRSVFDHIYKFSKPQN